MCAMLARDTPNFLKRVNRSDLIIRGHEAEQINSRSTCGLNCTQFNARRTIDRQPRQLRKTSSR